MITHLELITFSEYTIKSVVKINDEVITEEYFTRRINTIITSAKSECITVIFDASNSLMMTNDQNNKYDEIYIVDTVDGEKTAIFTGTCKNDGGFDEIKKHLKIL